MDMIKQDDAMVRYSLKNNLEKLREKIEVAESELVSKNPFDNTIQEYEKILVLLRTFIQEVYASPEGMYTIYSRYKIDQNDILNVLKHDYSLLTESKKLHDNFGTMKNEDLREKINLLRKIFDEREKIF